MPVRRTLQDGDTGQDVIDLQNALVAAGFSPGAVDGNFGFATGLAVRSFQFDRGLLPDGIVGDNTWTELEPFLATTKGGEQPPTEPLPISSIRVTSEHTAMHELVNIDGLSLVRGTATEVGDGRWSIVGYAEMSVLEALQNAGYAVEIIEDPATLQAQWDVVQAQVEGAV